MSNNYTVTKVQRITVIDDTLRDAIIHKGALFYSEAKVPGSFKVNTFLNNWNLLIKMGVGAMWRLDHGERLIGLFGATIAPDMCDGNIIAQECFWYVDKSSRGFVGAINLFRIFVDWAKKVGAARVIVTHLTNSMPEKLKKFYEREGFRVIETNYLREL